MALRSFDPNRQLGETYAMAYYNRTGGQDSHPGGAPSRGGGGGKKIFPRKAPHITLSPRKGGVRPARRLGLCPDHNSDRTTTIDTFFHQGGSVSQHRGSTPSYSCCPVTSNSTLAPLTRAPSVGENTPVAEVLWSAQPAGGGSALQQAALA